MHLGAACPGSFILVGIEFACGGIYAPGGFQIAVRGDAFAITMIPAQVASAYDAIAGACGIRRRTIKAGNGELLGGLVGQTGVVIDIKDLAIKIVACPWVGHGLLFL